MLNYNNLRLKYCFDGNEFFAVTILSTFELTILDQIIYLIYSKIIIRKIKDRKEGIRLSSFTEI